MIADTAIARNAINSMPIAAAEESVNMLSLFSLILFVSGTADDAADNKKYATTCNSKKKRSKNSINFMSHNRFNQELAFKALVSAIKRAITKDTC